jgi:hypothetical protein
MRMTNYIGGPDRFHDLPELGAGLMMVIQEAAYC